MHVRYLDKEARVRVFHRCVEQVVDIPLELVLRVVATRNATMSLRIC